MEKKIKQPNNLLRLERERRGYSQSRLGELIGADASMVSRWECGARKPERFYQEKLCDLFGKNAAELGLINQTNSNDANITITSHNTTITIASKRTVVDQTASNEIDSIKGIVTKVEQDTMSIYPNEPNTEANSPTRFLTMKPEELIERYSSEKENLLKLKIDTLEWLLPHKVVFDNTNTCLPINSISTQLDTAHPEYRIPTKIEGKAEDILAEIGHHFYDSTAIRLNGIRAGINSIALIVSKVSYWQYIATNYAMDALLTEKGWTRSLRDVVHPTNQLCKLEESLLANHIGIGTLIFTLDNYLVLSIRPKDRIGIWRQQITPSISGATSYDDDMHYARSAPIAGWMREGREELGIENSDFAEDSSVFLGLTRELLRGGKPEMFFATQLNLTKAKLEQKFKKARDRWESKEYRWLEFTSPLTPPSTEKERGIFLQEFLQLLDQYRSQLAPPAQANLALWFKYMWHA